MYQFEKFRSLQSSLGQPTVTIVAEILQSWLKQYDRSWNFTILTKTIRSSAESHLNLTNLWSFMTHDHKPRSYSNSNISWNLWSYTFSRRSYNSRLKMNLYWNERWLSAIWSYNFFERSYTQVDRNFLVKRSFTFNKWSTFQRMIVNPQFIDRKLSATIVYFPRNDRKLIGWGSKTYIHDR